MCMNMTYFDSIYFGFEFDPIYGSFDAEFRFRSFMCGVSLSIKYYLYCLFIQHFLFLQQCRVGRFVIPNQL